MDPYLNQGQNPAANAPMGYDNETAQDAMQGRDGDSAMAHVTRGDVVLPSAIVMEHPEFLTKLKKIMGDKGVDYRTHMVGSGYESKNPQTGAPEFKFGLKSITHAVSNIGGGGGGMFGGMLNRFAPKPSNWMSMGTLGLTNMIPGLSNVGQSLDKAVGMGGQQGGQQMASGGQTGGGTMALPESLRELSGLTDQQKRAYLATQATEGNSGITPREREYYTSLVGKMPNMGGGQQSTQQQGFRPMLTSLYGRLPGFGPQAGSQESAGTANTENLLPEERKFMQSRGVNIGQTGNALMSAITNKI